MTGQRRQWQPTSVLLPGKSHGWRSLVCCSPWASKESDTTEWLHFHFSHSCIGEGNGNPLPFLAWRILGPEEPGGLPSLGSHRVGHYWSDLAAAAAECLRASLVAQMIKNLPAMQGTLVWSLGWEDHQEKGLAIHSSILAWRIPWSEEPGGYSPWVHKESDATKQTGGTS